MSKTVVSMNTRARQRRTFNRKRGMAQFTAVSKAPTVRSVNRKVKQLQKEQELRWKDTIFNDVVLASDPGTDQILLLNGLVTGDDPGTRDGNKTSVTSIQIRGEISTSATLTGNPVKWRIIVIRDMQSNGTAPTAANLLQISGAARYVDAPYKHPNLTRFRIISDKSGILEPNLPASWTNPAEGTNHALVTVTQSSSIYKIRRSLNFDVQYGLANAGDITDISKNSIYILFLSDWTIAQARATFAGVARVYYKDS